MAARTGPPPGKARADSSLTALLSANVTLAQSLTIDAPALDRWYTAQLAAVEARYTKLASLVEANHAVLGNIADPNWGKWWLQSARMEYVEQTVALLRERKHLLCCPTHGIEGVDVGIVEDPQWYEALSLRGLVTGEGATAWARYCTECSKPGVEQRAERLRLAHAGEASLAPLGAAVPGKDDLGTASRPKGENGAPAASTGPEA